jgi:hypothetical protein
MKLKHGLLVRFGLRKGSLCCGNLSARRRASQKAVNLLDLNGVILKFPLEFSKVFPSGLLVRGGHSCSIKGLVVVANILPALFLKEMILFVCLQVASGRRRQHEVVASWEPGNMTNKLYGVLLSIYSSGFDEFC